MIKLDTVESWHRHFGQTPAHPQVGVVDLSQAEGDALLASACCTVWWRSRSPRAALGWKSCDFADGSLACVPPGQPVCLATWAGAGRWSSGVLCFQPLWLGCSPLGAWSEDYTFFRYRHSEALHVSARERCVVQGCLRDLREELAWGVDKYSQALLAGRVGLLLNVVVRFYRRQFITRQATNRELLAQLDRLLEAHIHTGQAQRCGPLPPADLARALGLSTAYLDDLVRHETGLTAEEYAERFRLNVAREQLLRTSLSLPHIAARLGYDSEQKLSLALRRLTGRGPAELRAMS